MIKKALFLFWGVVFGLIGLNQMSLAQNEIGNADLPMANVEIENIEILPKEGELEISAVLFNSSENIGIPQLTHLILLKNIDPFIKPTKEPNLLLPSLVVSASEGKEFFSLKPLEKREVSYRLPVTKFLPNANYELHLIIIDPAGKMLGNYKEILYNFGSNRQENKFYSNSFLAFDQENCFLITPDGKKHGHNDGPIFEPGESPRIQCLAKNLSGASVDIYPKAEWKEFYIYGNPAGGAKREQKINNPISFQPGETKLVDIFLPGENKPQVYQTFLSFEDKNGVPVSLNMFFRWIVRGQSARIKEIVPIGVLKNIYKEKENVSLTVRYFGSADLSRQGMDENVSEISDFKMAVEIKDKNGEICGQSEITLPEAKGGDLMEQNVDVLMDKKCARASYNVSLSAGGRVLAEESGVFPPLKEKGFPGYLWLAPVLALLAALVIIKTRKKRLPNNVIIGFFTIILFSGIFGGTTMADVINPPNESSIGFRAGVTGYKGQMFSVSGTSYGGEYNGETAVLYSGWHKFISASGDNWNRFKLKPGGNGKTLTANFNDYFDWQKKYEKGLKIYISHKPVDASSGKTYMRVKIKALMKTASMDDDDYEQQKIKIAPDGSENFPSDGYITFTYDGSDPFSVIPNDFVLYPGDSSSCSNNACGVSSDSSVEFFLQYDAVNRTWRPKTDSRLVVNFKQFGAGNDSQGEFYYPGDFDQEIVYEQGRETNEKTVRQKSDRIKVKIPLNLPNPTPKVLSFTASPSSVNGAENNKVTLTWKTEDVDYCNITATNDSGKYSILTSGNSPKWPSSASGKPYNGTAYDNNIKKTTSYALQCKKYFGAAIGEITYPLAPLSATVIAIAPTFPLIVNKTGQGTGTVILEAITVEGENILPKTIYFDSPGDDLYSGGPYEFNTKVTLTATPDSGFSAIWTNGCSPVSNNACSVTMKEATTVTVKFSAGTGGSSSSVSGGCGSNCPSSSSSVGGSSSSVVGTQNWTLAVNTEGTGEGTVTGGGLNCSKGTGICSASFTDGVKTTIKAETGENSFFSGWNSAGPCVGAGDTCEITMDGNKSATAVFSCSTENGAKCDPDNDGEISGGGGGGGGGGDPNPPPKPTLSLNDLSCGKITLSWNDVNGDGYKINRKIGVETDFIPIYSLPASSVLYNDYDFDGYFDGFYDVTYQLVAYNGNGESVSDAKVGKTPASCGDGSGPPPSAPVSDFSLSPSGKLLAVIVDKLPGSSNKISITVSGSPSGSVALLADLSSLPEGTSYKFEPNSLSSGAATLKIISIPGSVKAGAYAILIVGTDGSGTAKTASVVLNVEKINTEWEEI